MVFMEQYKDVSIYEADSHPSVWTSKTRINECELETQEENNE